MPFLVHGRDWLGRRVVTWPGRQRLGEVTDLLVDTAGRNVVGLVLRSAGLFGGQRIVPLAYVRDVAWDGIAVAAPGSALSTVSEEPTWGQIRDLSGKRLLSRAGEELGALDDIAFDPRTGAIANYRLTAGFVGDLLDGRTRLQASVDTVAGDHVIVGLHDGEELG